MVQPLAELQVNLSPQSQNGPSDGEAFLDKSHVEADGFGDDAKVANTSEEIVVKDTNGESPEVLEIVEDDMVGATRWQKAQRKKEKLLAQQQKAQKPIVNNELPSKPAAKPPSTKDLKLTSKDAPAEKPLSKAERRKKIKEEIIAAGQGETFQGYRRRMW